MVVTQLTCSSHRESYVSWMPSSDAPDSSPTSMGLLLKMFHTVPLHDTGYSLTLGDSNDINLFVLVEHLVDRDLLLQQVLGVVHLLLNRTSIDLDLEDVVLLLPEVQLVELSVRNDTYDGTILLYTSELDLQVLGVLRVLLLVLREGLLLGIQPVLVEPPERVLAQFVGPHGGQRSQSSGCLDVAHDTHNHEGRSLDDGDSFDSFLLVQLGTWSIHLTKNVGHTSLESGERGQVHSLLGVIGGVRLYSTSVLPYSASWDEPKVTVSGCFEFSVRHFI